MTEDEKNLKIATFKFGLISDFVTGVRLCYGDRERLLKEKVARTYDIPFSYRNRVSKTTLEKWILDYKKGGYCIEGLYPKERKDKGLCRSLPDSVKLAIKELKKETPEIKLPALVTTLRHKKLIGIDEKINLSTVYRYLRQEELTSVNEDAKDKRHFEASHPNELWQSDVMHGPLIHFDGKNRKSYLVGIIDDHSRLIIHAEFYLGETKKIFLEALRQAVQKRGLPQKLYIDNGACFKALHLEQVAAQLGIGIKHSRPYIPQGRGKIERWFKFVRDNFIGVYNQKMAIERLDVLNHHFSEWVEEYNNRVHGTTKEKPYDRYKAGLECVRPAPSRLLDYFRQIETRRVKKDRVIRLMGVLLEAPVQLIDRQVELRFHPEDFSQVEIFFGGKSYGMATTVDPHINSKIGRNWDNKNDKEPEFLEEMSVTPTGQLFKEEL